MTLSIQEVIHYIKNLKKDTTNHSIYEVEDLSTLLYALDAQLEAEYFIYCPELCYSEEAKKIINYFTKHNRLGVYEVGKKVYQKVVEKANAQGFIATFRAQQYALNDFKDAKNIVVLDGIETLGNLGTIIRTCDACEVDGIIVINQKARIFNPKVMLASRGMQLFLPLVETSYEECQQFLLNEHFDIYLAEPDNGKDYKSYAYQGKNAILVGSERYGIDKRFFEHPHYQVFIPMKGKMGSLNVGVAASIIIYEVFMQK